MTDQPENISPNFRCGYAAIIGEPNVGKSTLMNGLIGQKLSIVTPKPQTTRHKVLGILSSTDYQVVFLDTPGIIKPKYLMHEVMMAFASSALADADVVLFMIEATDPKVGADLTHEEAFSKLYGLQKPVFLVINKSDAVNKGEILPVIDFYSKAFTFKEIFPISALKLDGTTDLLKAIVRDLPEHPPYYPLDIVSEQSQRFFVSEIIREKIFYLFKEEVPYSTTVDVTKFYERETGKWSIGADIYVERDSQKAIIVGKNGVMIKTIGTQARIDIEAFLQHPVYLELHVKVRKDWRGNEQWLARLGYKS